MKIISLSFKNLNSLRTLPNDEPYFISFEEEPFRSAGLFAITGPTGAGKSTILDAISLALYGRTPRHGKNAEEMMSRQTGHCWTEVVFETQGVRYRSRWSLARARKKPDGKIQQPEMELSELAEGEANGVILEDKASKAPDKVAEITGLDYAQFTKSVILPQGDFAAFLKANEKDRSELLEKITGLEIYSRLSVRAFDKAKEEKEKLKQLEARKAELKLLSPEELEKIAERLDEIARTQKADKERLAQYAQHRDLLTKIAETEAACKNIALALNRLAQDEAVFAPQRERLTADERAGQFKTDLGKWSALVDEFEKTKTELAAQTARLPRLENDFATANENLESARNQRAAAQKEQNETEPLIEKTTELDGKISRENEVLTKEQATLAEMEAALELAQTELNRLSTECDRLNNDKDKLERWLNDCAADGAIPNELGVIRAALANRETEISVLNQNEGELNGFNQQLTVKSAELDKIEAAIKKLEAARAEDEAACASVEQNLKTTLGGKDLVWAREEEKRLAERQSALEKLSDFARHFQTENEKLTELKKQASTDAANLAAFSTQSTEQSALLAQTKLAVERLEQLLAAEKLIASLETHRAQLKPGEACPLCGSAEHPFAETQITPAPDLRKAELDAEKQALNRLQSALKELDAKIAGLQAKQSANEQQSRQTQTAIDEWRKRFDEIRQQTAVELSPEQPAELLALLNDVKNNHARQTELVKLAETLQTNLTALQQKIAKRADDLGRGQIKNVEVSAEKTALLKSVADKTAEIAAGRKKLAAIDDHLTQKLTPFGLKADENRLLNALEEHAEHYKKQADRLQETVTALAKISGVVDEKRLGLEEKRAPLANQQALIQALKAKIDGLANDRADIFGQKDPKQEKERLKSATERALQNEKQAETRKQDCEIALATLKNGLQQLTKQANESQKAVETSENKLAERLKPAGFADIADLKTAILPVDVVESLKKTAAELNQKRIELTRENAQTAEKLAALQAAVLLTENAAETQTVIDEIEKKREELQTEIGEKNHIVSNNTLNGDRAKELNQQIENQLIECRRWDALNDLIGSADGKKFRIYAQSITLEALVAKANAHLKTLKNRYSIRRENDQSLSLIISDDYFFGETRPMNSLSGGETFLVSLSLALGLSDLAGSRTQIQSLFIDEGFGSLDPDTLSIAIDALENLQASGKMIGVISHVDTMKERIRPWIQVTPQSGGVSKLEITP